MVLRGYIITIGSSLVIKSRSIGIAYFSRVIIDTSRFYSINNSNYILYILLKGSKDI